MRGSASHLCGMGCHCLWCSECEVGRGMALTLLQPAGPWCCCVASELARRAGSGTSGYQVLCGA